MLGPLKFVMGSVAKKDLLPALTHFRIENGTIRGYNGMLALGTPIPLDIQCNPKAEPMVRAIGHCDDTVSMSLTPAGRLSIKSGPFKAFVDCVEGDTPHVMPEGDMMEIDGVAMLTALKTVWPFIGDDASRPWSNGVLLKGQSAFATNNVTLVEFWVGSTFPKEANIPRAAIKEMLRINEAPIGAQFADNSITFHYEGERWLRTQLFSLDWPDISLVLDREANPVPLDDRLFPALAKLKPFTDKMGRIFIEGGRVATHATGDEGAEMYIPDLQDKGIFNIEMLQNLEGVVSRIDWSAYPAPCMFYGDRLRGAIAGIRP